MLPLLPVSVAETVGGTVSVPSYPTLQGRYYDFGPDPVILEPIDLAPNGLLTRTPDVLKPLNRTIDWTADGTIPAYFGDAGDGDDYADAFVGTITVGGAAALDGHAHVRTDSRQAEVPLPQAERLVDHQEEPVVADHIGVDDIGDIG